jgi:hypothetical protein
MFAALAGAPLIPHQRLHRGFRSALDSFFANKCERQPNSEPTFDLWIANRLAHAGKAIGRMGLACGRWRERATCGSG